MVKRAAPKTAIQPGDPDGRAAAAARATKGKPKRTKEQKEADRRMERLLQQQPKLPDDYVVPTAMEITKMARAFAPGALDFASEVLGNPKAELSDKFQAANLLLRHGASTNAAEQQEIGQLKELLDKLAEEHKETVGALETEMAKLRSENANLVTALSEANAELAKPPPPPKPTHRGSEART